MYYITFINRAQIEEHRQKNAKAVSEITLYLLYSALYLLSAILFVSKF